MIFTKTGYSLKYNLLHPWTVIFHWYRDLQCAWERATKGYCYRDVRTIDLWFLDVVPKMLDDLNKNRHGYPSNLLDDEWSNILKQMSNCFKNARFEVAESKNYYKDKYIELILEPQIEDMKKKIKSKSEFSIMFDTSKYTEEQKQIEEAYHNMAKDLEIERQRFLQEGFELFVKYFDSLGD